MRASHSVLKTGGIFAGYSIHASGPLTVEQSKRASDLGPSFVNGLEDPHYLAKEAGFSDVRVKDVTLHFRETCLAWIEAMESFQEELRELDETDYKEELKDKSDMLIGIEEGLLKRSLLICRRE